MRTLIKVVGGLEQSLDHTGDPFIEDRRTQPCLGIDACFAQPLQRQIEPPFAGIFADIAGNVGELHRDAELAGARQCISRSGVHDQRHHCPHGTGHPRAIGLHIGERFVAASFGIPEKAFEQTVEQFARDTVSTHYRQQGAIGVDRLGSTGINRIEAPLQIAIGPGFVDAVIDCIVGQPAEGIERGGRSANPGRQQQ